MSNQTITRANGYTSWLQQIYQEYTHRTCNVFVLTGNVGDYAFLNSSLISYLVNSLTRKDGFEMDEIYTFDIANEGVKIYPKGNESEDLDQWELFEALSSTKGNETKPSRKALILRYPEYYIGNNLRESLQIELHDFLTSKKCFRSEILVFFIAESIQAMDANQIFFNSSLKYSVIDIPLPDFTARKQIIDISSRIASKRPQGYHSQLTTSELAVATAGLTLQQVEDLILASDVDNPITVKSAVDKKKTLIQTEYSSIIELINPDGLTLDDFAGQNEVKQYFQEVVIDALANRNYSIIPKGVLLMGPPGTGKSYFAKCLAGSAGISCVDFKMSKILDKYVGVAEKRLDQAFRVFHAMAPVVVFIDELDQALSRGRSDSAGTNANIFGAFLAELSKPENRGQIIWLGATNYPNNIDEALKRAGRFDKKIPFFAPDKDERAEVIQKHLCKVGAKPVDFNFKELADKTEGYTQAEIEAVVVKALELASRKGSGKLSQEHLSRAISYMISTSNKKIKEMEDIALMECNDLEFVPEKYRERRNQLATQSN